MSAIGFWTRAGINRQLQESVEVCDQVPVDQAAQAMLVPDADGVRPGRLPATQQVFFGIASQARAAIAAERWAR